MATSLSQLSACVTRILSLTGFPKELKTRDIQAVFSEWENVSGGFKIKWIDDTSLLIVFNDATVGEWPLPCLSPAGEFARRLILPSACRTSFFPTHLLLHRKNTDVMFTF